MRGGQATYLGCTCIPNLTIAILACISWLTSFFFRVVLLLRAASACADAGDDMLVPLAIFVAVMRAASA